MDKRFYTQKKAGGLSPCILGNNSHGQRAWSGSVLPNCVGWAWGRWHEVAGLPLFNFFARGDAADLAAALKGEGMTLQEAPSIFGMMVWDNGQEGHVAIVEEIREDGSVVTSESGWYMDEAAVYVVRSGKDWRKGCSWMGPDYVYKGCVVHPCFPNIREIPFKDMATGQLRTCLGFYQVGRNYMQLSQLADEGYIRAGWDPVDKLPLIGLK